MVVPSIHLPSFDWCRRMPVKIAAPHNVMSVQSFREMKKSGEA
jgi:hypothetical protein